MLCYLNRGLILEQAVCAAIRDYFEQIHLDNTYQNFHVSVTTEHPFAELYLHDGLNASDSFPAVVITTQEDRKPGEFDELAPHVEGIGLDATDVETITKTTEQITKNGTTKTVEIPGLCTVVDTQTLAAINATIQAQDFIYGYSIRTRKKDTIGIEIWAENIQLKNELYEQVRLFITGNLRHVLENKYPFFDIALFDNNVTGHRSNNYNFDFDVALSGAHISLDVNYCVEQIVLNTDLTEVTSEVITEAINHG